MESSLYQNYVKILNNELVPALGCTEPIAIAYGAAKARAVLGEFPDRVEMCCSGNIIKNVMGVTVPNSGGLRGIDVAATLGIVGGNAERELEVLENITKEDIERTKALVAEGFCQCKLQEGVENLYIVARVEKGEHFAEVTIINRHTLITRIVKDGEILFEHQVSEESPDYADKSLLKVKDILTFAKEVAIEDVREAIGNQIALNSAISDEGMNHHYGAEVGRTLLEFYGNDVKTRARARAAAGSDARMGGCSMPVVINSGSGNQGITASIPVVVYARELNAGEEKTLRAVALSDLLTIHMKTGIGRLSAYCGAVSAGCAAGAAVAYLHGGGRREVGHTLVNALATISGMICDGAKPSCAAKIAAAVDAGILGWHMFRSGQQFRGGEGIVTKGVEETIANIGRLGRLGMRETDREIIRIMTDVCS